jgi:MoaA/NifB/PqqE/SkfB family radical SAM enzyme
MSIKHAQGHIGLDVHVVEHCNLKCKSCTHFSPVAEEFYHNPTVFERDFARFSTVVKKTGLKIGLIKMLGGEPLLHPQLPQFMVMARKHFKDTPIIITTNGILLTKQTEEFWESCEKNNVPIEISAYPIHLDMAEIYRLAERHHVVVTCTEYKENQMWRMPLDLSGTQDVKKNFRRCPMAVCTTLQDGKLYKCATSAHIEHFNRYFQQNLTPIEDSDYIDIYKEKSAREIRAFLRKPLLFCRYCDLDNLQTELKWETSKKNIQEWATV